MKVLLLRALNLIGLIGVFCSLSGLTTSWSPAERISSSNYNASSPRIAADPSGNAVAVWIEQNAVFASKKLHNQFWSIPENISGVRDSISSPSVGVDADGRIIVLWLSQGTVTVCSGSMMGLWGVPEELSSLGASDPQLAVDTQGNAVAIWVFNGGIQSSVKRVMESWSGPTTLSSASSMRPQIAIGGNGKVIAIWCAQNNATKGIYSASLQLVDSIWTSPQLISDPSQNCANPTVSVDPLGNAIAAWFKYSVKNGSSYSNVIVQTVYQPNQGVWGGIVNLSESGVYNPFYLDIKIVLSPGGKAFVIWRTSLDGSKFSLQGASYFGAWVVYGGDFITPDVHILAFDSAVNSAGIGFGVYMRSNEADEEDENGDEIESQIAQTSSAFFSQQPGGDVSIEGKNAYPRICAFSVNNQHEALTVWENYDGVTRSILSSMGRVELVAPPRDLSVVQMTNDQVLFTEYYNILSWTPSSSNTVIGYYILRNGLFAGEIEGVGTQFIDHNRLPNESVTYSVFTIDKDRSQSIAATITFP